MYRAYARTMASLSPDDTPNNISPKEELLDNPVAEWTISDEDEGEVPSDIEPNNYQDEDEDVNDENSDWDGDEDEDENENEDGDEDEDGNEDDDNNIRAGAGFESEFDDEEAEASSDTEDMFRIIDSTQAKSELADYHTMIIVPTNEEIAALAMIVRDAQGNIIDDNHSHTFPWITRFEKARVIGTRATQLSHGAPPQINVPEGVIDSMKIAEIELENGQIPFIIRRPLPNGTSEYWPVNELQIL